MPDGVTVSYEGNGQTEVGDWTVTANFTGDPSYKPIPSMTATMTIKKPEEKPSYDMTGVKFESQTFVYDGQAHSIFVSGKLPDGVTVSYEGNGQTEVGDWTVTANFTGDPSYKPIPSMTATMTIKKPEEKPSYDMTGVKFESQTFVYDGQAHSIFVSGKLPDGVTVSYEGNGQTEVGSYTVTANFTGDPSYKPIPSMTATLSITKANYNMSGVSFDDATEYYNAREYSIYISGTLPAGVTVSYEGNGQSEVGDWTVTANFTGDTKNYNDIPSMTATLHILERDAGPVDPPDPNDPNVPGGSENNPPVDPETPETPELEGDGDEMGGEQEDPENPVDPEKPETPEVEGDGDEMGGEQENPEDPEIPEIPVVDGEGNEMGGEQENSENPEKPEDSKIPEIPEVEGEGDEVGSEGIEALPVEIRKPEESSETKEELVVGDDDEDKAEGKPAEESDANNDSTGVEEESI